MKGMKPLKPGQKVRAYVSIEGRSLWGRVLDSVHTGVWVQVSGFPAPILFPHKYVEST